MTGLGLEHPSDSVGNSDHSEEGGAESGAVGALSTIHDPELQRLIGAWPTLPPAVKVGILAMVNASIKQP